MDSTNNRPEEAHIPEEQRAEAENEKAAGAENVQPETQAGTDGGEKAPEQPAKDKKAEKAAKKAEKAEKKAEKAEDGCAAKLAAEHDRYLRLAAEYDNYRKRSNRERESIYSDVRADTVTQFLPVYDNLARALEQSTADEAYRKGVELIMTQFKDILGRMGVTEIEALGRKFDPALHNAVMHDEDETKGEGEIVQELQKGFKLGDKVIRFAMVKVVN